MRHYNALVIAELMGDWSEHILKTGYDILKKNNILSPEIEKQYKAISEYCKSISHNPLGRDRMNTNPEYLFEYDIISWLNSVSGKPLKDFKNDSPRKIVFQLSDEQFKFIEDKLNIFGDTTEGKGQVIKRSSLDLLWRKPIMSNWFFNYSWKYITENIRNYFDLIIKSANSLNAPLPPATSQT